MNLGDGLVNVQVGDVTILQNVTIDAAVAAVVQLCPSVSVQNVILVATQIDLHGGTTQAFCNATSGAAIRPVRISNNGVTPQRQAGADDSARATAGGRSRAIVCLVSGL
jgi:hypothetical protein